jgi:hypothetical protein
MTGIAGVGKTAIAMSTIECLLDRQPLSSDRIKMVVSVEDAPILYGQYFCNAKLDTSKHHSLFPTLALQIAETSPAAALIIDTALNKQPSLGNEFSLQQAKEIFLRPICHLAKVSPSITLVVVIDGVDEFQASSVYREVTSVLGHVAAELPTNARLLIFSRPEDQIIRNISSHIRRHDLATEKSYEDVRQYLHRKLTELDVDLDGFPSTEQVDTLANAAAGHFGWANQALNWLSTELRWIPDATLDWRIKALSRDAAGDLDNLYLFILSRSLPLQEHPQRFFFTLWLQKLLRFLSVLQEPQPIHVIDELIQSDNAFDTLKCLRELSSIYADGTEVVMLDTVPQPHKSFFDFIAERAPKEFRIEKAKAHEELASSCFRIMKEQLHFNMGGFDSPAHNDSAPLKVAAHITYACSSFAHHVNGSQKEFVEETRYWAEQSFLFWLEVLVLSTEKGALHRAEKILESFGQVTPPLVASIQY